MVTGDLYLNRTVRDLAELKNIKLKEIRIYDSTITNFSVLDFSEVRWLALENVKGELDLARLKGIRLNSVRLFGKMSIKNVNAIDAERFSTDRNEYIPPYDMTSNDIVLKKPE